MDFRKEANELWERDADRDELAAALQSARNQGIEEAAKVAEKTGNFGDYMRDELTPDYGQPKFDMMTDIAAAIRALKEQP